MEAHKIRVARGDYNIAEVHLADAIEALVTRQQRVAVRRPIAEKSLLDNRLLSHDRDRWRNCNGRNLKLNVLKPSVNNMTVRVFVRAAELDFTEDDV